MGKTVTTRTDPDIEAIYRKAWQAVSGVAVAQWRGVMAIAVVPTVAMVVLGAVWNNGALSGIVGLVYLATVALAFSWYLRACLQTLNPVARGAKVGLEHYVWRIALAWMLTVLPAVVLFAMVEGAGLEPASAGFLVASVAAFVLTVGTITLAAATSAQVAITGHFSPLAALAVMKGRRLVSMFSLLIFLACAGGFGPFLMLPSLGLSALSLPEPIPTMVTGLLLHIAILLGLSAISLAVLERAAHANAMNKSGGIDRGSGAS